MLILFFPNIYPHLSLTHTHTHPVYIFILYFNAFVSYNSLKCIDFASLKKKVGKLVHLIRQKSRLKVPWERTCLELHKLWHRESLLERNAPWVLIILIFCCGKSHMEHDSHSLQLQRDTAPLQGTCSAGLEISVEIRRTMKKIFSREEVRCKHQPDFPRIMPSLLGYKHPLCYINTPHKGFFLLQGRTGRSLSSQLTSVGCPFLCPREYANKSYNSVFQTE